MLETEQELWELCRAVRWSKVLAGVLHNLEAEDRFSLVPHCLAAQPKSCQWYQSWQPLWSTNIYLLLHNTLQHYSNFRNYHISIESTKHCWTQNLCLLFVSELACSESRHRESCWDLGLSFVRSQFEYSHWDERPASSHLPKFHWYCMKNSQQKSNSSKTLVWAERK